VNAETNRKRIRESLEVLEESVEKGLQDRQQTIGFSLSSASTHYLELFLHQLSLTDPGFILKHQWLKSQKQITTKLPFDFPCKQEILDLMASIEEKRNVLCYGRPQKVEVIQAVLEKFYELKKKFKEVGLEF